MKIERSDAKSDNGIIFLEDYPLKRVYKFQNDANIGKYGWDTTYDHNDYENKIGELCTIVISKTMTGNYATIKIRRDNLLLYFNMEQSEVEILIDKIYNKAFKTQTLK